MESIPCPGWVGAARLPVGDLESQQVSVLLLQRVLGVWEQFWGVSLSNEGPVHGVIPETSLGCPR